MAKCQVNSTLQPYPHEHIHSEGHYILSVRQADYKLILVEFVLY